MFCGFTVAQPLQKLVMNDHCLNLNYSKKLSIIYVEGSAL